VTRLVGVAVVGGLGSENQVFARLLRERGDDYDALVVAHRSDTAPGCEAEQLGELAACPVIALDTGWRPTRWSRRGDPGRVPVAVRYRRRLGRVVAAAAEFEPTVVYSSQQHYDCRAASAIASSLGVPQILHLHYTVGPWLRHSVLERLRTTDRIVTVSDFIREQVLGHGVPEERVTTIRNTVPAYVAPDPAVSARLRRELGVAEGDYVYGMVGRLDPGKGHLDAIAAFEQVAVDHPDAVLVMVGSGRIEERVLERARTSPASSRILATGQRSDVPDLLSVFDALVHPASQDPCPLAVLEAMAAALPVIGYDDGGVPELVDSGRTGLLVEHGRVDSLAAALATLIDDRSLSREYGTAAAGRVATEFAPAGAGERFAGLVTALGTAPG
jgi:glycosyltransferase involved in cell wall biosynthesis